VLDRRHLLLGVPLALLAVRAQPQSAPKVIGVLSPYAGADVEATLGLFRQAMRDLGYAEGRGFTLVARFADGRHDRLPSLAAELVKLRYFAGLSHQEAAQAIGISRATADRMPRRCTTSGWPRAASCSRRRAAASRSIR